MRITKADNRDDEDIETILESTEVEGRWSVPDNTDAYFRVQLCCDDPGYGECRWRTLFEGQIDSVTTPCDIAVVGVALILDENNNPNPAGPYRCGGKLRVHGAGGQTIFGSCAPGITSLKVGGVVVGGGSPFVGCVPEGLGPNCAAGSALLPECDGIAPDRRYIDIELPTSSCNQKVAVEATNGCGQVRVCEVTLPCEAHYNYYRVEVPTWNGLNRTCSGAEDQPPGWPNPTNSDFTWAQSWSNAVSLTGSVGGSYFVAKHLNCPNHNPIATGTFDWRWIVSGLHRKYDSATGGLITLPMNYDLHWWGNIKYSLGFRPDAQLSLGDVIVSFDGPLFYHVEQQGPGQFGNEQVISDGQYPGPQQSVNFQRLFRIIGMSNPMTCSPCDDQQLTTQITWEKITPWDWSIQLTPGIGQPPQWLIPDYQVGGGWTGPYPVPFSCVGNATVQTEVLEAELISL
jgi:hypothetical protein